MLKSVYESCLLFAGGTWEDLLFHLDKHFGIIMDAKLLDGSLIGDILLSIVKTWGKKTKVTVTSFCQICKELGNTRVVEILEEAKNTFDRRKTLSSFPFV